ncbi:MAG: leucine-rich repeat protein [Clostridiaceae bacterium]|jgi:uncharacterized repeat protein (TIGR02543 family)|nr:leucine-rich repeat protein [Clostridiaceae bacterium]
MKKISKILMFIVVLAAALLIFAACTPQVTDGAPIILPESINDLFDESRENNTLVKYVDTFTSSPKQRFSYTRLAFDAEDAVFMGYKDAECTQEIASLNGTSPYFAIDVENYEFYVKVFLKDEPTVRRVYHVVFELKDYRVAFASGNGETINTMVLHFNDALNLPILTRYGFAFGGWYDDAAGLNAAFNEVKMPNRNLSLTALWISQVDAKDVSGTLDYSWEPTSVAVDFGISAALQKGVYRDAKGNANEGLFITAYYGGNTFTLNTASAEFKAFLDDNGFTGLSVIGIADGVFAGKGITSVTVPDTILYVGANAFDGASALTYISGISKVEYIGASAFEDTKLESASISTALYIGDNAFNRVPLKSATPSKAVYIGVSAFEGASFETVNISAAVEIGASAFKGNTNLKEVILPVDSQLRTIGALAFFGTVNLDPAYIFNNATVLEYIGDGAFYKVGSGLTLQRQALNLPNTVKYVGDEAFRNAQYFGSINLYGRGTSVLETIGENAFRGTNISGRIEIPETVTKIGSYAFAELKGLTELYFSGNSKLAMISDGTFYSSGISGELVIPDSVTYIGNMAFASCIQLKSVYIGSGVTEFGSKSFSMAGIQEVRFASNGVLEVIGSESFKLCNYLLKVEIPATVKKIDRQAFSYARALSEITMLGGVPPALGVNVFLGAKALTVIYVPAGKNEKNYPYINVYSMPSVGNVPNGLYVSGMSGWSDYNTLLKVRED